MGETVGERRDRNKQIAAMERTAKALERIAKALEPTSKETTVDENVVRFAIQFKNRTRWEDRYLTFDSEAERDEEWNRRTAITDSEETLSDISKIQLIIRVETEY